MYTIWTHFHKITRIGVFAQGQILCISPNGLQTGHCDAPTPPLFWMTKNEFWSHFSPFQINTQLLIFWFCSQNGCRRPFWMTEHHFRSHFSPFQINTQLFFPTKWLPAALLDDRSKVNFGDPKWPTSAIFFCQKFPNKIKVTDRSEMAINAIESEFRTSKMGAGGHLVNYLKWPEMRPKVIFGYPKWPAATILNKNFTKIKIVVLIWNGKKCDTKLFLAI